ncbi:MAG: DinB family protein [Anditalea sp.]
MKDKADAWQMEIATISWEFEELLKDLSYAEINLKPQPSSWSIAENLSHLIRLNESYYPIFDQVIAGNYKPPFIGKVFFLAKSFGNLLYRAMTSKGKTKTFAIWEPVQSEFDLDIAEEFNRHQMELSAYVQKLDPFFETGTVIHSPAHRFLVYPLDKAIDIIIAHEKRHLEQSKSILSSHGKTKNVKSGR